MAKKVESIKHKTDTRAHIPSKEEAGYEDANAKVQDGKKVLELSKNPVVHRGQDPELFWLNKYGNDDRDDLLRVDIRSLYRHEHIAPETLIKNLYKVTETKSDQMDLFNVNELFGNALDKDEVEKVSEYYHHQDGWTNRLIQGDSHLVMASLLEREGMAGQVQTIYFDPPYGIKYGSNWQVKFNERDVKDNDENLSGEPEMIKAFRDTWELGIHSYLSYLRDRLVIAKQLLTDSGSCFVQISDVNMHLVRSIMDEILGSENFVSIITYRTSGSLTTNFITPICDYIIWYAKDIEKIKYRKLFMDREVGRGSAYDWVELPDGTRRKMTTEEKDTPSLLPKGARSFTTDNLVSSGYTQSCIFEFDYNGRKFFPSSGRSWKTTKEGMQKLADKRRLSDSGATLRSIIFFEDYPVMGLTNVWTDLAGAGDKQYVVQTNVKVIQRCLLMTTDPGDLVLDPTCGSGTTAYVAEQFGRRWLTIDTSRIALNIAKQRLMTAIFPYYKLYDEVGGDMRQGFLYRVVPHVTLKSITNNEPPATETLYDQPIEDKNRLRVSGPFTVETLQNFEPISPEDLDDEVRVNEEEGAFEEVIKQHLISAGIKNGRKDEMVVFRSVELLSHSYLHAEGFYVTESGEQKAYFHIGPKFGTVSKTAVNEAVKECRQRGDAGWLIILGFSFESDIEGSTQTISMGKFEVTKVRIHDDLLQEGLKKKPAKSAASFVTIGEPDIDLIKNGNNVQVEIKGLDIYDPIKDEVKARNISDIAYWMVDDDYDGSNFVVKQVFFCGGEKAEFDKWKKGLDNLAKDSTKKKVEKTLKIEIDDEAFDRLYGHISHPIEIKKEVQKIAVRIISQFGEESTKVLVVN
jgi:adenine-specific DNA-methyltransferase